MISRECVICQMKDSILFPDLYHELLRSLAFSLFSDIIKLLKTGETTMSAATDIRLVVLKDSITQLNTTIQNQSELLDSFKAMI